jgi:hypothetical protein
MTEGVCAAVVAAAEGNEFPATFVNVACASGDIFENAPWISLSTGLKLKAIYSPPPMPPVAPLTTEFIACVPKPCKYFFQKDCGA